MKAKVSRGGGFRGALNYVFDIGPKATGHKKPERVGGNMAGQTVAELIQEFAVTKKLRPDCSKPVWHCSLALPAGERLSAEKWNEISTDFMREMGMGPENFLFDVERHNDSPYDHIHIVASRIGLDGQLWHGGKDVFTAMAATEKLEKKHGLTLTPGFDPEHKSDRKPVTHKEMNMAIRTETKPPRMVCQEAIDEVLQRSPVIAAPEFIRQLDALGVRAVPNIAATGTMNGFSFETDGISFTGSKLGDGYKWSKLQQKGIEYVKTRDFESLTESRRSAFERVANAGSAGRDNSEANGNNAPGAGAESVTATPGPDNRAGYDSTSTTGNDAPRRAERAIGVRPGDPGAEVNTNSTDRGNKPEINQGNGIENGSDGQNNTGADRGFEYAVSRLESINERTNNSNGQNISVTGETQHGLGFNQGRTDRKGGSVGKGIQQPKVSDKPSQSKTVEGVGPVGVSISAGKPASGGWASRFKQASAARSAAAKRTDSGKPVVQSYTPRNKVDAIDIDAAREIDPTDYLRSHGYDVTRVGIHISVRLSGEEVYRITEKSDGHYVTCDNYENGVGDNIALVRELEPDLTFADAVYKLSGAPSAVSIVRQISAKPVEVKPAAPPTIPPQTNADINSGRAYLISRGIDLDTIKSAEASGFLRYTGDGVLFTGRDEKGLIRNITRRSTDPTALIQKKEIARSLKDYCQMLNGAGDVWLVEGGIDALALHSKARRESAPAPTVIVTGGAGVRSFLNRPFIQRIIKAAKNIFIAQENETKSDTQTKTDNLHIKQGDKINEITGNAVIYWKPEDLAIKDIADLNKREIEEIKARLQAHMHQVRQGSTDGDTYARQRG